MPFCIERIRNRFGCAFLLRKYKEKLRVWLSGGAFAVATRGTRIHPLDLGVGERGVASGRRGHRAARSQTHATRGPALTLTPLAVPHSHSRHSRSRTHTHATRGPALTLHSRCRTHALGLMHSPLRVHCRCTSSLAWWARRRLTIFSRRSRDSRPLRSQR